MCKDQEICESVCRASRYFTSADGKPIPMIGAPNTIMESTCEKMGIPFVQEFIADLEYDSDGNCIITRSHDAVDLNALGVRVAGSLRTGTIETRASGIVDLKLSSARLSLCIHSDTPGAVEVAAATREQVDAFNKEIFP